MVDGGVFELGYDMTFLLAEAATGETYGVNIMEVIGSASFVVQAVLFFLLAMSVACWFIIGYKWYYFARIKKSNMAFLEVFWSNAKLDRVNEMAQEQKSSPVAKVFSEAYAEMVRIRQQEGAAEGAQLTGIENVERTIRRATMMEVTKLEKLVPFLGTTGSTAPFIGLFGTVWGIVEAFDAIPKQTGGVILDKVAGPMAHALIATAVGLLAAIPAVMAYNWFVRKTKVAVSDLDAFGTEFLNIVRRHFFRS